MAWFLKVEKNGHDLYPTFRTNLEKPEYYINEKVRGEVARDFGYFMTESSWSSLRLPSLVPQEQEGPGTVLRPARPRRGDGVFLRFCEAHGGEVRLVDYLKVLDRRVSAAQSGLLLLHSGSVGNRSVFSGSRAT